MNICIQRNNIVSVIPPNVSYDQLALALKSLCNASDVHFCRRQVGYDKLLWKLPDDGWTALSVVTPPLQQLVRQHFEDCCQQLIHANRGNVALVEAALSVPSDDFIFFRQQSGGIIEIAVTAWGYKFPKPGGGNPPKAKGHPHSERQDVRICFVYDSQRLPDYSFSINDIRRQTSAKGVFEAGTHSVGTMFPIATDDGSIFTLIVEKGKVLYEFDLTKYFMIEVNVQKGGKPLSNVLCELFYNGRKTSITTGGNGRAEVELPFAMTSADCTVTVEGEKQSKQATMPLTVFNFDLPYEQTFCNVDSMSVSPISGVKNVVTITYPDGTTQTTTVVSDAKGLFSVVAKDNCKLDIMSTKSSDYNPKHTEEPLFRNARQRIPMTPTTGMLHFRTLDATTGALLPKCNLKVIGTRSGSLKPSNSGNGEFDVTIICTEQITITASKKGYIDNTDKINNKTYEYLIANQERRDIPLKPFKPIKYEYKGNHLDHEKTYNMYLRNREFKFEWNVCSGCTTITLIDATGNVLGRYGYGIGIGLGSGSVMLRCPTETLKVVVHDQNRHDAHYIITSS